MKNIVYLTDDEKYEFDSIEELKLFILPSEQELASQTLPDYLYEKVFGFCAMYHLQVVDTHRGVLGNNYTVSDEPIQYDKAVIVDNFDTYLMSLCKFNVVVLLEEKNHRYYTKDIEIPGKSDNYIIVNAYAKDILKAMVGDQS